MKTGSKIAILSVLALPACGASEEQAPSHELNADPRTSVRAQELVVHEFEVEGDQLRIIRLADPSGNEVMVMRDEGRLGRPLVVDSLIEQHGPLTLLETFHALAPTGLVPHESVVRSHETEARVLHREDATVQRVELDTARMDKISTTDCSTYAWPTPPTGKLWMNHGSKNSVSGFNYACLNNDDCSFMTACYTASHVCNDSNTTIYERNAYDFDSTNPWQTTAWSALGVNAHAGWYMPAGGMRRYSADGSSTSGKNYHLRSAVLAGHSGC